VIEFVTLLLGLISGPQVVEVRPARPVAAVEMVLDGETVARRTGPPWRFVVDFGDDLAPHQLAAVALDAAGREVARASQSINAPREVAEARWLLTQDADGRPVRASLTWELLWAGEPRSIEISFDGRVLDGVEPRGFDLPPYDASQIHRLAASLTFADGVKAAAEVVFGGEFGDRVSSDLTAVPVRTTGRRAPQAGALQGAFVRAGRPVPVIAVDAAAADVVLVRDRAAQERLAELVTAVEQRYRRRNLRRPKDLLPLGSHGDRVRFVWTEQLATRRTPGRRLDPGAFPQPVEAGESPAGLLWPLVHSAEPAVPQRTADAVALAGLLAAGGGRPRVVVLVLDPSTPDRSRQTPAQVRRYLRLLQVPLRVWSVGGGEAPGWGKVEPVGDWEDLRAAVAALRRDLRQQAVVWVEGRHPPGAVTLAPAATAAGLRPAVAETDGEPE